MGKVHEARPRVASPNTLSFPLSCSCVQTTAPRPIRHFYTTKKTEETGKETGGKEKATEAARTYNLEKISRKIRRMVPPPNEKKKKTEKIRKNGRRRVLSPFYAAGAAWGAARYAYGGLRCSWRGLWSADGDRGRLRVFASPPDNTAAGAGTGDDAPCCCWEPPALGLLSRLPMAEGLGDPAGGGAPYCACCCPSTRGMSGAIDGWS